MQNFQSIDVFALSVSQIITNIGLSLLCSFFVTVVYRFSYKGPGYSESFVNSLIYLSTITTLVIMVIGNNLARAFGLVGALSIIRFRTAIKDTVDIVYIFLSLAIGMAAGVGYHKMAVIGTLTIGAVLYLFSMPGFSFAKTVQYLLQFEYQETLNKGIYKSVFDKYCRQFEVVEIRAGSDSNTMVYTYYIRMKRNTAPGVLIEELNSSPGIAKISMYFDQQNGG